MKYKTFFLIAFATLIIAWGIKFSYIKLTDGFSIANISSNHGYDPRWETTALTLAQADEVDRALEQDYTYLGKGHQAYVFESADKAYVIKFLKFQKYRLTTFPLPSYINNLFQKKIAHKEAKRDALFNSWQIALVDLPEQTQVFYVHINPTTHLEKTLTIHNKSGISYSLNLDDHVFLLQRKADLLETILEKQMHANDTEAAKKLIDSLISLYQSEYRQGLFEEDRYIVRNTGVAKNLPIHIDVGRFRKNKDLQDPAKQAQEIAWKTSLLKEWLAKRYPVLHNHLNERLESITKI